MDLQRFLYIARCSFRVCCITITNLYCIPTYLLWMWVFFLPFRLLNYPTYWYVEGVMYKWLLSVVASWSWGANYAILELGDDIDSCIDDRCLFLVNHQSTADVPLLMLAFNGRPNVLQSIMWVMDRLFRYTNFGAVSVTHGDYFITQGKNVRDYQMKKLRDHLLNIFIGRNRRWIILFPEGGFLSKRKETSAKYAEKNNFPVLNRVTLPRVGAMNIILDTLRPENIREALDNGEVSLLPGTEEECAPLKWVIDVTVAYPESQRPLDLLAICAASRPSCITYLHYRRYSIEDVPFQSMEVLRDWVYDRWTEKEQLLNEYYSTGEFPLVPKGQQIDKESTDSSPRAQLITMSEWWIAFLHIFFVSSSVLHCYLLCKMWHFVHT